MAKQKEQKLKHQEVIDDNEVDVTELPMEIRKKIQALKPLIGRFNKTPSDNLKQAIIKQDVDIANMIADHLEYPDGNDDDDDDDDDDEDDLDDNAGTDDDDDDDDQDDDDKQDPPPDDDAPPPPPPSPIVPPPEPKAALYSFGTQEMEDQIRAECTANNGFISTKNLETITKKDLDWDNRLDVFTIKMKKLYLKSVWQLIG